MSPLRRSPLRRSPPRVSDPRAVEGGGRRGGRGRGGRGPRVGPARSTCRRVAPSTRPLLAPFRPRRARPPATRPGAAPPRAPRRPGRTPSSTDPPRLCTTRPDQGRERCPQEVIHRPRLSTGGYPQAYAHPRPGSGAWRGVRPNVPVPARSCGVVPVSRPGEGLLPCPHLRGRPISPTNDGLFPVDNPVHSLFAGLRRECAGGRKKFFAESGRVIHRRGLKSVDNPVDNLWTTTPGLWVTRGRPVDRDGGHRVTGPPAAVDNLRKTCGRACGRTVENLGTTRFIHRTPKLCTGFSTSPVDKNSGADLVKRGLSTVSTGPTTTAHLH